jgi:hypothetical protein
MHTSIAATAEIPRALRRLEVFLVRPTKYDEEGFLLRYLRGVLPSNTLACLHSLTEAAAHAGVLGHVQVRTHLCDESVQRVPERRIARALRRAGTRVVVGLVGVQTSQFPRALDLARRFRARGATVIVGGFHVSGTLAMIPGVPAELQQLMDEGVTLVKGEVEEKWSSILRDVAAGRPAPLYDLIADKPDLSRAPVPRLNPQVMRRFVYRHFGTIDAGRGCPFTCSFCTIINVQGRKMRCRDAAAIGEAVEANYRETQTHHYFFTDDNFARNPNWKAIFDALIRLRERAGIPIRFLMQVDVLSHRIPGFIELAKRAGCFQVFIGMESLNPESLCDAGKRQNKVEDYAALIRAWHAAGILTHVGYIIGFPHDSPESVRENIRTLKETIRVDIASFFMLTPLPGSADHLAMSRAGTPMDADLNRYDTFRPVIDHPIMSRETWLDLYRGAWRQFYDGEHMRQQLQAVAPEQHVTLLQMYLWYLTSVYVEDFHPMMAGFVRLRPRTDRRAGTEVESRLGHFRRSLGAFAVSLRGYVGVLRQVERLWFDTRRPAISAGGALKHLPTKIRVEATFLREMFGGPPPAVLAFAPQADPVGLVETAADGT